MDIKGSFQIYCMDYDAGLEYIDAVPVSLYKHEETNVSSLYLAEAEHRLQRGPAPSFVYFLLASLDDEPWARPFLKIGVTSHPLRRLNEIRKAADQGKGPDWVGDVGGSDCMKIICLFHGDRTTEKLLHKAFAAHRVAGEWFDLDPIENQIKHLIFHYGLRMPEELTEASLDDWRLVPHE